jgi:type VI secretion system protein ImpH
MATASGPEDTAVERRSIGERWPIADALDREPWRFEFFQAVRLLARMAPERQVPGRFTNPHQEVAHFGAHPRLAFPASQIQALERRPGAPAAMHVNFMGLTGPLGVLPLAYSELVLERLRNKDATLRDFLDVFNHRMISLFYQAWEKYRFFVSYERGERDLFSHHVLALLGLDTPGLQDRQDVPDDSLLFYSGLTGAHGRSAIGLEQMLSDYFGADVQVEQFVGAWYPVEPDSQCSLSETGNFSEQLGFGAVVGDQIWDQQSRIRIRMGPLPLDQYKDFLPGGLAYRRVKALAAFYVGGEYDVELQLVLKREDVPPFELSNAETGPQLGWTSWVKSGDFSRDPGETVLEL